MKIPVYLASRNPHKCHEIEFMGRESTSDPLLRELVIFPCVHLSSEISWEENGTTYLENARIKTDAIRCHTSERVIADDSGLEVAALKKAPGVYTSSYGGVEGDHERNINALLKNMRGIPENMRNAAFVCLIVYIDLNGQEWVFQGRLDGMIAESPRGNLGFGYDPIFIPQGFQKTLAELNDQEKNAISHRGQAVKEWIKHLSREMSTLGRE